MAAKKPARRRPGSSGRGGGSGLGWVLCPLTIGAGLYFGVQFHQSQGKASPARPGPRRTGSRLIPARAKAGEPRRARSGGGAAPDARPVARRQSDTHSHDEHAISETAESSTTDSRAGSASTAAPAATLTPLPPTEIDRGSGLRPEVALTFDAGAAWKPALQILETLAANEVRCTFFLTGEWVRKNSRTAARIAADGHEIGNHSWDHPAFTGLTDDGIRDQLRRTEMIIRDRLGRTSHPYFRPPLGARDGRVLRVVGEEGFLTIYWTLDSRDSVERGITAAQIRDRVLSKTHAGSIVLMHCGSQPSADALAGILAGLKTRGLSPVTLSRLLHQE